MGYGPLVRGTIGVTRLWTSDGPLPDNARHPFYDATTIFPDHVVARVSAIGALAGLIRRLRTGAGARIHVPQAEVAINQLDVLYVAQASHGTLVESPAVHAVLPCAGDDEWCVVSIENAAQRRAVEEVTGGQPLASWTRRRTPAEVAEQLQFAGVPAGPMNRAAEVHGDPQLQLRKVFTDMTHPAFERPMPTESGPAPYRHIPPAAQRPAPLPGGDTREICHKLLNLEDDEIDRLISDGVLFTADQS